MKTALIILDGFGNNPSDNNNAIAASGIPNLKKLMQKYPHSTLKTSGRSVGLPGAEMGNSEVGHLNIGAGRVVIQDLTMIEIAIEKQEFSKNPVFLDAMDNCIQNKTALHLMGLLSDGSIHSHINHLFALLDLAKQKGLKKVYVHALMDGRDTPPTSGDKYINQLQDKINQLGIGQIATVIGRYYAMDRDNRWDRVKSAYDALFDAIGKKYTTALECIQSSRAENINDEFIPASVIGDYAGVTPNDSIIFFNYRADRAREISRAILEKDFDQFPTPKVGGYKSVYYVGMTEYHKDFVGIHTAFPPKDIQNTLGQVLAQNGLKQARVAETEKYAHVTFFFNGGVETPNQGEIRILVPSPKVATYDLQPEMSAMEVTEKCLQALDEVDVLIVNYANCDMVGHTGNLSAATNAVTTVDTCVGKLIEKILSLGGNAIITADHGNSEQMAYDDGSAMTSHTTFDVPMIVVGQNLIGKTLQSGSLCDIAPTLLGLMGIIPPKEMTGKNLIG